MAQVWWTGIEKGNVRVVEDWRKDLRNVGRNVGRPVQQVRVVRVEIIKEVFMEVRELRKRTRVTNRPMGKNSRCPEVVEGPGKCWEWVCGVVQGLGKVTLVCVGKLGGNFLGFGDVTSGECMLVSIKGRRV